MYLPFIGLLLITVEFLRRWKASRNTFAGVLALPAAKRAAWVCGLGHGVLQHTPEDNVRLVLNVQREMFG